MTEPVFPLAPKTVYIIPLLWGLQDLESSI
jgi:hypothetical protein